MINFFSKIRPISLTEKMLFTRNLAVMIKSGVSLPRSLEILAWQIKHPCFRAIILEIQKNIQKGSGLSDAFSKHQAVFNQFYINMIKVGETGGSLEYVLNVLAKQMKKEHQLKTKVRGAMIYPALILITLITIGILMIVFVVPKLNQIFIEMQAKLPLSTRFFLALATNIRIFGLYFATGLIVLFLITYFYRRSLSGKRQLHKLLLHLPFLGQMSRKINITRLASNLASLLESGVSLLDALRTLKGVLGNTIYQLSIEGILQEVQKGEALSNSLKKYPLLYSPLLIQMIEVGEETGTVSQSLSQIAEFYENEIDEIMKNLSSIIEPVLMIIIGAIVGLFALSMISPIYSIIQNV